MSFVADLIKPFSDLFDNLGRKVKRRGALKFADGFLVQDNPSAGMTEVSVPSAPISVAPGGDIQAALDAAAVSGAPVYLLPGIHYTPSTLLFKAPNMRVYGAKRGSSIRPTGNFAAIAGAGSPYPILDCEIRDIEILTPGLIGVDFSNFTNCTFHNLTVVYTGSSSGWIGMLLAESPAPGGPYYNKIINPAVSGNGATGSKGIAWAHNSGTPSNLGANADQVYDGHITNCDFGLYCDSSTASKVYGTVLENIGVALVYFGQFSGQNEFNLGYYEGKNTAYLIRNDSTSDNVVRGPDNLVSLAGKFHPSGAGTRTTIVDLTGDLEAYTPKVTATFSATLATPTAILGNTTAFKVGSTDVFSISANGFIGVGSFFLSFGTSPAASGFVRVPNNTNALVARSSGGHDLRLVATDASDNILIGENTYSAQTIVYGPQVSLSSSNRIFLATTSYNVRLDEATAKITCGFGAFKFSESAGGSFGVEDATSDHATHDLNIIGQFPYSSATGTNRNSGNIIYTVQPPAAGGAAGHHSFFVNGLETLRVDGTQVSGGAATASGTYGSTEQAMLQACYDALRSLKKVT